MKKIIALLLCMLTIFAFTACSTPIYPGLPDISEDPMKGIEIYCWQNGDEWKCGGTVGTNRMKTDEETYSNSFGWITIKAVNIKTKAKKILLDMETQ